MFGRKKAKEGRKEGRKERRRAGRREDSYVHDVAPEPAGGESSMDDDRAPRGQGGEEAGDEAVHVEEWHDQEGAVGGGELVGCLGGGRGREGGM